MGKTIYESEYYPETTLKWNSIPSKKWFDEHFFPEMEKLGYLKKGETHFVMGLSTGGRGAVILALNYPHLFKGVASFSGDFDQSKMPKDRLMTSVYGNYEIYPERWLGKDNPQNRLNEWNLPIYLGHGKADKIVPFDQTKNFYESLKKSKPNLKIIFNEPANSGHDYIYWESEVKPSFDFFESLIEKKREVKKKYIFF
jgi:S-formylglutathione hydrolase FrmB